MFQSLTSGIGGYGGSDPYGNWTYGQPSGVPSWMLPSGQQAGTFRFVDTSGGPGTNAGAILGDSRACQFLQLLGQPCNLEGIRNAVAMGKALVVDQQGNVKEQGTGVCTPPTIWNSDLGSCIFPGSPGAGGGGQAQMGAFGIPAVAPTVVGQRQSNNGTVPIRECPTGTVLGKDNLCYAKGSIPMKFRKWRPAKKAPITAADAAAIRKADRAKTRVKKLAGAVGFSCRKR